MTVIETPGLLPSPEDSRDALYGAFESLGAYADTFELPRLPFYRNQLQQFSCVIQSIARIMDYANKAENDSSLVSARYGFAYAKILDGYPSLQGTFFKTGFDIAVKQGLSLASKWPDDASLPYPVYITRPSAEADHSARPFRIKGYIALKTPDEIKDYLTKYRLPVLIGINSNNSGWGNAVVKANNNVLVEVTGSRLGHAVACIGWNDQGWVFDNSWGESWGDGGRATVPYNYSGLQATGYAAYDLPNNWQSVNTNYQMTMKESEINAVQFAFYKLIRGEYPKPEEMEAVRKRNINILGAFKAGGVKGQEMIEQNILPFRDEFKKNIKDGII